MRTDKQLHGFLFILFVFLTQNIIIGQQSTTGSTPPAGINLGEIQGEWRENNVVIEGVPVYNWYRGCAPTAMGMVIGYYDSHGFDDLIEGDASTQTDAVNNAIATDEHYTDYSLPKDYYPDLVDDNSANGNTHVDNCIADFMLTSQSYVGNYWGWTWLSGIGSGFEGYFNMKYDNYTPFSSVIWYSEDAGWEEFKYEIDHNKPVILLVDTDGDNATDHFVTGVGYNEDSKQYGIYDTWSGEIRWHSWLGLASGNEWGIYSFSTFVVNCNITGGISPAGTGTATGFGYYEKGTAVNLSAMPEDGYSFVNWTTDGIELSTDANYSFEAEENTLIVANFEQTVDAPTIDSPDDLRIFPNPARTVLMIKQEAIQAVTISDATGRIMEKIRGNHQNTLQVNIDNYPKGIYFVEVKSERNRYFRSFVVE